MPAPKAVDGFIDPEALFERMRRLAAIDAIAAPDVRSFEWHPKWARGERMAGFKDGSGNVLVAWSNAKGTVVRGFDQDVGVTPSLEGFPKELSAAIDEPAFGGDEDLTFVWWNLAREKRWYGTVMPRRGVANELVEIFGSDARRWLELRYGHDVGRAAADVLDAKTMTRALLDAVRARVKPKEPPKPATTRAHRDAVAKSFGEAEFVVRCEPTVVKMLIHGTQVVASANEDVYLEIFDWVKARLKRAGRATRS